MKRYWKEEHLRSLATDTINFIFECDGTVSNIQAVLVERFMLTVI